MIDEALAAFRQGRLDESEGLLLQVLHGHPDEPEALHLLAALRHRQLRYDEATLLSGRANQLSGWRLPGYLNLFGLILGEQLAGWESGRAARLREDYRAWCGQPRPAAAPPRVSVVLVAGNHGGRVEASLESIYRQTWRDLELIVVIDGSDDDTVARVQASLGHCPFPSQLLARPRRGLAASLNEGIALARGDYVHPFTPDGIMAPGRIAALVDAIALRGFDWGYAAGGPGRPADWIREQDTAGSGFLVRNLAGSVDNLFFSRKLFDSLAGFLPFRHVADWDFCLRALWLAEPALAAEAGGPGQHPALTGNEAASETGQILAAYHRLALAGNAPNRFAPTPATRGLRYFRAALEAQHGMLFPPRVLVDLAARISARRRGDRYRADRLDRDGLNVLGYMRAESGLGEAVRALVHACREGGIPVTVRDADVAIPPRQADFSLDPLSADTMAARTTLLYLNPDMLQQVWQRHGKAEFEHQYVIGFWFWELERLPAEWRYAFDLVDEIWVASEFVRAAVAAATTKPVIRIPYPIEAHPARLYRRAEFGLPEGRFLFLFSFDFSSYRQRKNPEATLAAFRRAFPVDRDDVGLVIKCSGAGRHPDQLAALRHEIGGDRRIQVIDQTLPIDAMHGLQSACDAYVSLHRAEGLGLGMAEAMALGKPAIATGYSGNLEFMNGGNSVLVDYRLIPVEPGQFAHWEAGWQWADADIGQAAAAMQRLVAEPGYRDRIGRQAAQEMAARFNRAAMAAAIRARLKQVTDRLA
jgi:glycosyltransferase involved in cell wall biosynthesis